MRDAAKVATLLVVTHLAVMSGHGAAHAHLGITTSLWQSAFITAVIFVAPLIGMGLTWTRKHGIGITLLALSFAGSFIFGLCYHFVLPGRDNVFSTGHTGWNLGFRITAVALALLELVGCVWFGRSALHFSQEYRPDRDGFAGS